MMWMPPVMPFKHLEPGQHYAVVLQFTDYDSGVHRVGESWVYRTYNFLPYDDGLSLYATIDGKDRQVRMRWVTEDQGPVTDRLDDYLRAAGG